MLIDESHNLRNREGKRYQAIQEYIGKNDSKVILLSATPYNKTYLDLSNQFRLFIDEDEDIGIRPERLLREWERRSSSVGIRVRSASLWPRSRRASTPTTGGT